MRTLSIDCTSEACSTALFDGPQLLEGHYEEIGRGHAERLVPMIAELPDKGRADRILVSLGPGSFTGVRIGLAAARALGLAWNAEVFGYPTLALVAARAGQAGKRPVTVCMTGGHGEWFLQNFDEGVRPEDEARSLTPEDAAKACRYQTIAGSKAIALANLLGDDRLALDLLPDARSTHLLQDELLTDHLAPIYGRPPDARLPGKHQ